jgi:hypothetical protein
MARRTSPLRLALVLALGAHASRARAECAMARSVALEIRLARSDAAAELSLARHVTSELRTSDVGVCTPAAAEDVLAHVRIRGPLPDLGEAIIVIESDRGEPFERRLELTSLPPEARPLAIATAADELLRSVLAESSAAPSQPEPAPLLADRARSPMPEVVTAAHRFVDLGLFGGGSSFFGEREALGGDLLGRFWATERISLTARAGGGVRLRRPPERGVVQPKDDLHAGLGVGVELLPSEPRIGLLAEASLNIMRVGFDQGDFVEDDVGRVWEFSSELYPLDDAWAFFGGLGAEGRLRGGVVDFSVALTALVPLVPATSDWGETTSIERMGVELRVGVWVPLVWRQP